MLDEDKTKKQLITELALSSQRIARFGEYLASRKSAERRKQKRRVMGLLARVLLAVVLGLCGELFSMTKHADAAGSSNSDQVSPNPVQKDRGTVSLRAQASNSAINTLTEEERTWLSEHPVIRVVQDPGWPPIEFVDDQGENVGITGDYLKLIEQRLGITLERVRNLSWQESYARLKRWEIDMTTSVAVTPERAEFWAFTEPYMKTPIVISTQTNVTYISGMRELAGRDVAVVDGYAVCDWIPRDFPGIRLIKVKTAKEGLDLLQQGHVFAYIDNMLVVSHYLAKLKVTNIKIAGETPYVNAQSMAVRKDWAVLAGILQKALDSISETEHDEIYKKWMPLRYEHGFNYDLLWRALAIFALILLPLVVWNRRLSGEIRHRKTVEIALSESEKRMKDILNNVGAYVFIKDTEYRYTYVNNKVCDLFGRQEQDILGRSDDAFFSTSSVEEIMQSDRPVIEKGETVEREEKDLSSSDKRPRTYWAVKIPLRDNSGRIYGLCGISTDITERVRAESALREYERRFLETLDNIKLIALMLDTEGNVRYCNDFFLGLTGWRHEEVVGHNWVEKFVPPHMAVKLQNAFFKSILDGCFELHYENEIITRSGKLCLIAWNNTLLRDAEGKITGYTSIGEDITERRLVEDRLKASLQEKTVLLREVHHRVKNNMQIMSSLLQLQAAKIRDPDTRDALDAGRNRIKAMALVHESIYRSENMAGVDLGDYVEKLAKNLLMAHEKRGRHIALNIESEQVSLPIDRAVPCGLIMNELISNALKHAFPGYASGKIDIRISRSEAGEVILIVRDDGIGLPTDTDLRGEETLGISLILEIVEEQLGGRVEMSQNDGTEFRIRFNITQ